MSTSSTRPAARSTDLQRDAAALQAAVAELVRVYQFRDRDRICCHDISVTQCYALETLVEHAPMRLNALAERLFLDKSTTSRVVASLVKKGYVAQAADDADARATALHVTAGGRRLHKRITEDLIEQQKALLQDLEPDVRDAVVEVIRGLARAADSRFRTGVSVGSRAAACTPAGGCCD